MGTALMGWSGGYITIDGTTYCDEYATYADDEIENEVTIGGTKLDLIELFEFKLNTLGIYFP